MSDDPETRRVVTTQERGESIVLWLIIAYGVVGYVEAIVKAHFYWADVVFMPIATYLVMALIYAGVRRFLFRPIRALRFGACVRRLNAEAKQSVQTGEWVTLKYPSPNLLIRDTGRHRVIVEGRQTGFRRLALRPEQIVEVKVEREQIIETVTKHGPQMIFMPVDSSIGFLSGGRSRSTSTVHDTAYLEISYLVNETAAVRRIVFDFGEDRRRAENWALSIDQLRQRSA